MVQKYGNTDEPGTVSLLNSEYSIEVSTESPAVPALVGPADLSNGSASAGEVKVIGNSTNIRNFFGADNPLTRNIADAVAEGANPVYAAAAESVDVTAEDLSTLSSNVDSLENAPVKEDATSVTFSINGSDLDTVLVYDDPESDDPGTDEVHLNPISGAFAVDSGLTVGNTGDEVDYTYHDYTTAIENITSGDYAETIDQYSPVTENETVHSKFSSEVKDMATKQNYAACYFPVNIDLNNLASYTPAFDTSRVQLQFPARDDGDLIIGAYLGLRSRLGINTTAIKKRLTTHTTLDVRLTPDQRKDLINSRVVPVQSSGRGAQIMDDINTVDPEQNEDEANIRFAYSRHVADYITGIIEGAEEEYIGDLHRPAKVTALEGTLVSRLRQLQKNAQLISFNLNIESVSSTKASVEIGLDLADPLRFIENNIIIEE